MKRFLLRFLITAVVAYFLPQILEFVDIINIDVHFNNFRTALFFSLTLALLNVLVKPILSLFALPLTLLTLGLFTLVINAFIVLLADLLLDGMYINGFGNTLVFSILLSVCCAILRWILIPKKK